MEAIPRRDKQCRDCRFADPITLECMLYEDTGKTSFCKYSETNGGLTESLLKD